MRNLKNTVATIVLFSIAIACENGGDVTQLKPLEDSPIFMDFPADANSRKSGETRFAVYSAEYITTAESGQIGRTIFFNDVGNKQLTADFVPGISLDGTDAVSYYIDEKRASADLGSSVTSAAISRAMNTWEGVTCSTPGLHLIPFNKKITTGFISELVGFGGSMEYVADVVHAGWLGADFFNTIAPPDGSTYILGVTFTIIFTDDSGNPTDLDNNGKLDVAWREIYYNDTFPWADGAHYDVETIALHESGHGLSQGHFGSAFLDAGSGKIHFSPLAVMNAAYSGLQTTIGETDNAGHCSIWGDWVY